MAQINEIIHERKWMLNKCYTYLEATDRLVLAKYKIAPKIG